ncbi:3-oxoadipate enol-lactonase [Roseibium sp. MMSF_3544]|uniref:3-oxoadipate enol-lactonase n=1 Tax=unclassified Roseibium TaxID=2629323 RepID=UPI00273DE1D7|nr:3-oxoadipate enol-lactonase [Roseibium sp. MMSF_3544]
MTGRVDLGSHSLQTYIDGPEGAPWLILSNSLGASAEMWDPQIPALSEHFRVLRYDTRGHGKSDVPSGPYTFDHLVGDVISLMDRLDIETARFMGLSKGAMTGLGLALAHPDRIERVVCADGRSDAPPPFKSMWDDRIGNVEANGMAGIVDGTMASWFTPDWLDANPETAEGVRRMILSHDPAGYIANCRALQGLDYFRRLDKIGIPVLYVGGSHDKGAAPAVMQAMADATPGASFVEIPNAAHVANINAPEAFNAAVMDFLTADVAAQATA